jgi:hypothetical protein
MSSLESARRIEAGNASRNDHSLDNTSFWRDVISQMQRLPADSALWETATEFLNEAGMLIDQKRRRKSRYAGVVQKLEGLELFREELEHVLELPRLHIEQFGSATWNELSECLERLTSAAAEFQRCLNSPEPIPWKERLRHRKQSQRRASDILHVWEEIEALRMIKVEMELRPTLCASTAAEAPPPLGGLRTPYRNGIR